MIQCFKILISNTKLLAEKYFVIKKIKSELIVFDYWIFTSSCIPISIFFHPFLNRFETLKIIYSINVIKNFHI